MEKVMQYIWQHRLWRPAGITTVDGVPVEVVDPGLLNTGAGPDFFNAKVRVGERMWAGNVELHVRATDWHRHGHHTDPAYDTVILHVVEHNDGRVYRSDGAEIPQIVMPAAADVAGIYHEMISRPSSPPCAADLPSVGSIYLSDWLTALAFERLQEKADRVASYARRCGGDWKAAIYIAVARALGFGTNSDAFERLALAVPLRSLMRHRDATATIEGALFGQAGLLPDEAVADEYALRLRHEHEFMSRKYGLPPAMPPQTWRMGRMRPQNFPHRRIALLSALIHNGFTIADALAAVRTPDDARALFDVAPGAYWQSRYTFGDEASRGSGKMGATAINILIINAVAPALYAYGSTFADTDMQERAVELLQALPAENNMIVRDFRACGIGVPDAFTSQALVQLRRCYCDARKCLYCRLGHRILSARVTSRPSF